MQRTEWGYATHPNIGGALLVGLGCEVMQIPGLMEDYGLKENENFHTMTIQATGGTRKTIERGVEMIKEMLPRVATPRARDRAGLGDHAGAAVRRLRRLFRHHRQPRARQGRRPARRAGRHGGPLRDAGDLRRRASPHPPRGDQGDRREADRHHQVVGGLHRAQPRRDEQQPLARQQGRRAHHHPREVARRRRQGRHHHDARRLPLCRADQDPRLRLHGFARLRPGRRHRPGGLGLQHHRLHHRPRLGLRLQADAVDQARHQQRHLLPPGQRTWTSTAATSSTA